jgi:hypothetical protein
MIDLGTQYTLAPECGLDRGNIQYPAIVSLSGKYKISRFNFLVDLKEQFMHCDMNRSVWNLK